MITDSFRKNDTPIMSPADFCGKSDDYGDVCIIFFSLDVLNKALKEFKTEVVTIVSQSIAREPIYRIVGTRILFYRSQMGAPSAGMMMDEASFLTGAKTFIVFGSCGILRQDIAKGKIIVPTCAYRDEGFSYHFLPNSDYVSLDTAEFTASFMAKEGIPFIQGKVWTCDAFYHETKEEMALRVKEGCIAVDMECAGLAALSKYRHFSFYTFFFGGDLLDAPVWNHENLGDEKEKRSQQSAFQLAYLLASQLSH